MDDEVIVMCDECTSFTKVRAKNGETRTDIMRRLKRKGWVDAGNGVDLCPSCAKRRGKDD